MKNNLLNNRFINPAVKSSFFPAVFQFLNLAFFIILVLVGLGVTDEAFRYTNLSSFVVWVIWWPMVVIVALFAGRAWCTICHLKPVGDWINRVGFQWKPPRFLYRSGTSLSLIAVVGMFVLHSSVVSYEVNHLAHLTAWYLIFLFAYCVLIALFFEKGAFCRAFCPLIGFFDLYTRLSPTELRVVDKEVCQACDVKKECVAKCPANLYLKTVNSNEGCLLCFDCVKNCSRDNIRFSIRPFFKDLWDKEQKRFTAALAVILLLGIIFEEVGEEWAALESVVTYIPKAAIDFIGGDGVILGGYHWLESLWLNLALPFCIIGFTAVVAKLIAKERSVFSYLTLYSVGFIPLLFSLHVVKHWHKLNGKLGYISNVIKDPSGVKLASAASTNATPIPEPVFMSPSTELFTAMLLVMIGLLASLYVVYKISQNFLKESKSAIPFAATLSMVGCVFLFLIYHWLGQS